MGGFRSILCLVDSASEHQPGIELAATLVQEGGKLRLLDVSDEPNDWLRNLLGHRVAELEETRWIQLDELADRVRSQVRYVSTEVLQGRPAVEVVRAVQKGGFDLVVKDTAAPSGQKRVLFGPTDMRLVRNCPCPLLLNLPDGPEKYSSVLAAIDPTASEHKAVNQRVLELAQEIAVAHGASLNVVAAWRASGESLLMGRVPHERVAEYVREHQRSAERQLAQVTQRLQIDKQRVLLKRGEPDEVILGRARDTRCELLVLGSVARGSGLLMGNTADLVLRQIRCSVVTVKPADFTSPLGD